MDWLPVTSSKIKAIRYLSNKEVLEVAFRNGEIVQHQLVPPRFWTELSLAESTGRYYYDNIKDSFPSKRFLNRDYFPVVPPEED